MAARWAHKAPVHISWCAAIAVDKLVLYAQCREAYRLPCAKSGGSLFVILIGAQGANESNGVLLAGSQWCSARTDCAEGWYHRQNTGLSIDNWVSGSDAAVGEYRRAMTKPNIGIHLKIWGKRVAQGISDPEHIFLLQLAEGKALPRRILDTPKCH